MKKAFEMKKKAFFIIFKKLIKQFSLEGESDFNYKLIISVARV